MKYIANLDLKLTLDYFFFILLNNSKVASDIKGHIDNSDISCV